MQKKADGLDLCGRKQPDRNHTKLGWELYYVIWNDMPAAGRRYAYNDTDFCADFGLLPAPRPAFGPGQAFEKSASSKCSASL